MGGGTKEDPWVLKTPPGKSEYQMYKDEGADPPALMCVVGSTKLSYQLRCLEDAQALVQTNEEKELVRGAPGEGQVADWVSEAKELPGVLTY